MIRQICVISFWYILLWHLVLCHLYLCSSIFATGIPDNDIKESKIRLMLKSASPPSTPAADTRCKNMVQILIFLKNNSPFSPYPLWSASPRGSSYSCRPPASNPRRKCKIQETFAKSSPRVLPTCAFQTYLGCKKVKFRFMKIAKKMSWNRKLMKPAIPEEDDGLTEDTAKGGRLVQHSWTKFSPGLRDWAELNWNWE